MEIVGGLAINLAVVGLFLSLWVQLGQALNRYSRLARRPVFGAVMGAAAVASMLTTVQLQQGVMFDLRNSLLTIAALFGGPAAMAASLAIAGLYRLVVGGLGTVPGLVTMLLSSMVGLAGYAWGTRRRARTRTAVVALGSGLAFLSGLLLLPPQVATQALATFALPVAVLTGALTWLGSQLFIQSAREQRAQQLLHAALIQSPDFQYVKDADGRFVAANNNVVRHHGRKTVADLVGLSDEDLEGPERGRALRALEAKVIETGEPLLSFDEEIAQPDGIHWFRSSKVALRDDDGVIIGLAGTTLDVTRSKQLEADLRESRDMLAFITANMSDGLAMFDRHGTLQFCNAQYRSAFPLTTALRRPGVNLRSILQAVVDTGEQLNVTPAAPQAWIEQVMASLQKPSEEQIELYDGRWLHCRTRPTDHGSALVVISDITTLKKSERALQKLTGDLETLASTDGLTGLLNRRAFDVAIARATNSARDTGKPLSLLMIDVDHFKGYNDQYGHPAGDECLRAISACLRTSLRRADDVAARYGGEEFVAILPDTDEDAAFAAANRFRANVEALQIPNGASLRGVVTVSIGISCVTTATGPLLPADLVLRSDEALYEAKGAGRNRVNGWRASRLSRASM